MKNLHFKLTERQRDLIAFLKKYFKMNRYITPCILAKELDINLITAYEHLRNLKEKGILEVKFLKDNDKGRPKYLYYLTYEGKRVLSEREEISELKKFIDDFIKAKQKGNIDQFINDKLKIFTKKTLRPILFLVLGFLILLTFFSNIKELETLKEFLIISSTSSIVFLGFTSYLFYLISKYVYQFKPYQANWEDVKFNLIFLKEKERKEIVKIFLDLLEGGVNNGS